MEAGFTRHSPITTIMAYTIHTIPVRSPVAIKDTKRSMGWILYRAPAMPIPRHAPMIKTVAAIKHQLPRLSSSLSAFVYSRMKND